MMNQFNSGLARAENKVPRKKNNTSCSPLSTNLSSTSRTQQQQPSFGGVNKPSCQSSSNLQGYNRTPLVSPSSIFTPSSQYGEAQTRSLREFGTEMLSKERAPASFTSVVPCRRVHDDSTNCTKEGCCTCLRNSSRFPHPNQYHSTAGMHAVEGAHLQQDTHCSPDEHLSLLSRESQQVQAASYLVPANKVPSTMKHHANCKQHSIVRGEVAPRFDAPRQPQDLSCSLQVPLLAQCQLARGGQRHHPTTSAYSCAHEKSESDAHREQSKPSVYALDENSSDTCQQTTFCLDSFSSGPTTKDCDTQMSNALRSDGSNIGRRRLAPLSVSSHCRQSLFQTPYPTDGPLFDDTLQLWGEISGFPNDGLKHPIAMEHELLTAVRAIPSMKEAIPRTANFLPMRSSNTAAIPGLECYSSPDLLELGRTKQSVVDKETMQLAMAATQPNHADELPTSPLKYQQLPLEQAHNDTAVTTASLSAQQWLDMAAELMCGDEDREHILNPALLSVDLPSTTSSEVDEHVSSGNSLTYPVRLDDVDALLLCDQLPGVPWPPLVPSPAHDPPVFQSSAVHEGRGQETASPIQSGELAHNKVPLQVNFHGDNYEGDQGSIQAHPPPNSFIKARRATCSNTVPAAHLPGDLSDLLAGRLSMATAEPAPRTADATLQEQQKHSPVSHGRSHAATMKQVSTHEIGFGWRRPRGQMNVEREKPEARPNASFSNMPTTLPYPQSKSPRTVIAYHEGLAPGPTDLDWRAPSQGKAHDGPRFLSFEGREGCGKRIFRSSCATAEDASQGATVTVRSQSLQVDEERSMPAPEQDISGAIPADRTHSRQVACIKKRPKVARSSLSSSDPLSEGRHRSKAITSSAIAEHDFGDTVTHEFCKKMGFDTEESQLLLDLQRRKRCVVCEAGAKTDKTYCKGCYGMVYKHTRKICGQNYSRALELTKMDPAACSRELCKLLLGTYKIKGNRCLGDCARAQFHESVGKKCTRCRLLACFRYFPGFTQHRASEVITARLQQHADESENLAKRAKVVSPRTKQRRRKGLTMASSLPNCHMPRSTPGQLMRSPGVCPPKGKVVEQHAMPSSRMMAVSPPVVPSSAYEMPGSLKSDESAPCQRPDLFLRQPRHSVSLSSSASSSSSSLAMGAESLPLLSSSPSPLTEAGNQLCEQLCSLSRGDHSPTLREAARTYSQTHIPATDCRAHQAVRLEALAPVRLPNDGIDENSS